MRRIIIFILFSTSFLIGFFLSYFLLSVSRIFVRSNEQKSVAKETQDANLKDNFLSDLSYNILLLGFGGEGHEGGNLTDSILIVNINPKGKRVVIISIPRDLWVEIPIRSDKRESFKINHAYAIGLDDKSYPLKEPQYKGEGGGATMAKKVVKDVTGLNIDYYIAVDFSGFKNIIDLLGGIEVDVPLTFDDYFYPIKGRENDTCGKSEAEIMRLKSLYSDTNLHHQFECRYEHIHFDKGKNKMDGETALKFVRSRSSVQHGGDFARSQRQQAVLLAIKDKLFHLKNIEKIDDIFNQLINFVRTDLNLEAIKNIYEISKQPEDYKISLVNLNEENVLTSTKSIDGQFILVPKEGEGIWKGVQEYIYEELRKI